MIVNNNISGTTISAKTSPVPSGQKPHQAKSTSKYASIGEAWNSSVAPLTEYEKIHCAGVAAVIFSMIASAAFPITSETSWLDLVWLSSASAVGTSSAVELATGPAAEETKALAYRLARVADTGARTVAEKVSNGVKAAAVWLHAGIAQTDIACYLP